MLIILSTRIKIQIKCFVDVSLRVIDFNRCWLILSVLLMKRHVSYEMFKKQPIFNYFVIFKLFFFHQCEHLKFCWVCHDMQRLLLLFMNRLYTPNGQGQIVVAYNSFKVSKRRKPCTIPICLHTKMKFLTRYDMWSVIFYISLNEFFTVTKNPDRNVTKLIWNLSKWPNFIKNCETFFSR